MSYFFDDPKDHPDAITIEVAGKEVDWLLNKSAFETAAEEIDFAQFRGLEEDDVLGNLDALSTLLYVGTLPFEGGPSKQDFDQILTPRIAAEVGPQVMAQFEGLADEQIEDLQAKKK